MGGAAVELRPQKGHKHFAWVGSLPWVGSPTGQRVGDSSPLVHLPLRSPAVGSHFGPYVGLDSLGCLHMVLPLMGGRGGKGERNPVLITRVG